MRYQNVHFYKQAALDFEDTMTVMALNNTSMVKATLRAKLIYTVTSQ
jgi:hypothetical protein